MIVGKRRDFHWFGSAGKARLSNVKDPGPSFSARARMMPHRSGSSAACCDIQALLSSYSGTTPSSAVNSGAHCPIFAVTSRRNSSRSEFVIGMRSSTTPQLRVARFNEICVAGSIQRASSGHPETCSSGGPGIGFSPDSRLMHQLSNIAVAASARFGAPCKLARNIKPAVTPTTHTTLKIAIFRLRRINSTAPHAPSPP